jgi:hypothetical protein
VVDDLLLLYAAADPGLPDKMAATYVQMLEGYPDVGIAVVERVLKVRGIAAMRVVVTTILVL